MKHLFALVLALSLSFTVYAQYLLKADYLSLETEQQVTNHFTFQHLQLYPLYAGQAFRQAHEDMGNYDNLQEALENQKVIITEMGSGESTLSNESLRNNVQHSNEPIQQSIQATEIRANNQMQQQSVNALVGGGAQVNSLMIENTSQDTIYLMAGEVIKGGKQDRVLAQDMILAPNSGKIDLGVFCVEQSRWRFKSEEGQTFGEYYGVVSNRVRKVAILEKSQSKVWENVAQITAANEAMTESKTYTALANSDEYQQQLLDYRTFFLKALGAQPNCIGFVGLSGDRIIGMDLFATPELFQKQVDPILNAYITEAISQGGEISIQQADVAAYLAEFLTKEDQQGLSFGSKGDIFRHKGKKLHISTY